MKKTLLKIGTLGMAFTPIVAAVSCGTSDDDSYDGIEDLQKFTAYTFTTKGASDFKDAVKDKVVGDVLTTSELGITPPAVTDGVTIEYKVKSTYDDNLNQLIASVTLTKGDDATKNNTKDIIISPQIDRTFTNENHSAKIMDFLTKAESAQEFINGLSLADVSTQDDLYLSKTGFDLIKKTIEGLTLRGTLTPIHLYEGQPTTTPKLTKYRIMYLFKDKEPTDEKGPQFGGAGVLNSFYGTTFQQNVETPDEYKDVSAFVSFTFEQKSSLVNPSDPKDITNIGKLQRIMTGTTTTLIDFDPVKNPYFTGGIRFTDVSSAWISTVDKQKTMESYLSDASYDSNKLVWKNNDGNLGSYPIYGSIFLKTDITTQALGTEDAFTTIDAASDLPSSVDPSKYVESASYPGIYLNLDNLVSKK